MMKSKLAVSFLIAMLFISLSISVTSYPSHLEKIEPKLRKIIYKQALSEEEYRVNIFLKQDRPVPELPNTIYKFTSIPALTVTASGKELDNIAALDSVEKIVLDRVAYVSRSSALPLLKTSTFHSNSINGTSINVSIVDTGVFNHTEFQNPNRIIAQKCYCSVSGGCCPPSNAVESSNATDDEGHGTHVTGISSGLLGSANATNVMSVKVLNSAGSGTDSDIASGIEWAFRNGAKIISLSLGGCINTTSVSCADDCYDTLTSKMVENAVGNNTVVVVSAGNCGPGGSNCPVEKGDAFTITWPGCAKGAITVGATNSTDGLPSFSSRGPTDNDNRTKPDLNAPGVSINSTDKGANAYATSSGTSMSAPFVSGVAALLMQRYNQTFGYLPEPGRVKAVLLISVNTSGMNADGFEQRNNKYGGGRLDANETFRIINFTMNNTISQGQVHRYKLNVTSHIKVSLVWMENSTTSNNLNLIVGNATNNFTSPTSSNDTVEQLFLYNVTPYVYNVYVQGIIGNNQPYFLASNMLISSDLTPPNLTLVNPQNISYNTQSSLPINFSTDSTNHTISYILDGGSPVAITGNTTFNVASDGSHSFTLYVNDSFNNTNQSNTVVFSVETLPPRVENISANPASPITYSPGRRYTFNISVSDTSGISKVIFEFNATNYTSASSPAVQSLGSNNFSITLTDLGVSTANYTFRWYANDTSNNFNSTALQTFNITQNSTNLVNLLLNNSASNLTVTYPSAINATAYTSFSNSGTVNLYRNESLQSTSSQQIVLGNGAYVYKANITGNANYSSNATGMSLFIFVNKGVPVLFLNNGSFASNTSGLVGYWRFEENSGSSATDSSGNNNTGTLTNMNTTGNATSGWNSTDCKVGNCLRFDGINDYVEVNDSVILDITNTVTVEAWIKPLSFSNDATIITKKDGDFEPFRFTLNTDGSLTVQFANSSLNREFFDSSSKVILNQWNFVAFTWNGRNISFYVNDRFDRTLNSNLSTLYSTDDHLWIGLRHPTGDTNPFNGTIDEVRIWNRSLSSDEVYQLYQSRLSYSSFQSNDFVGYWRFEDGSGSSTTADSSKNNNTGTLTNMNTTGNATSGWSTGRIGNGLLFDGVDDYVRISHNSNFNVGTGSFTITMWVKKGSHTGRIGGQDRLIIKSSYPTTWWAIDNLANGQIQFESNIGGAESDGGGLFNNSDWKYIAVVVDRTSNTVGLYFNGSLDSNKSVTFSGSPDSTNPLDIAENGAFNGTIDEVKIYNRALTANEIYQLYQSPAFIRFTSSENNIGDSDVTYTLFRNNTNVNSTENNTDITLGVGYYFYLFNSSAGSNWTQPSILLPLNITRATGNISLFLSGNETNISLPRGRNITLTSIINTNYNVQLNLTTNITNYGTKTTTSTKIENTTQNDNIALGLYNVTAYFSSDQNYTSSSRTLFLNITLDDPPTISNADVDKPLTYVNESVNISATITDDVRMNFTRLNFTRPDNTSSVFNMTNVSSFYSLVYNETNITGIYNVSFSAIDVFNNTQNTSSRFEVSQPVTLILNSTNGVNASNISIRILFNGTSKVKSDFVNNTISLTIPTGIWDLIVNQSDLNATIRNANFSDSTQKEIKINYSLPTGNINITSHVLNRKAVLFKPLNISFTTANLSFTFNNSSIVDSSKLKVYRCTDWNSTSNNCSVSWVQDSSDIEFNASIGAGNASLIASNFSAFALGETESYCGDSTCGTGESCSSCSSDCGACPSSSSPSGGGGGGGGGAAATTSAKEISITSKLFPSMQANITTKWAITDQIGINEIKLHVNKTQTNVNITVQKLDTLPKSISLSPEGIVYRYFNISDTIDDKYIVNITLNFSVNKTWINDNKVTGVSLDRYSDGLWNELPTKESSSDASYKYFEAVSPGLSVFSVEGKTSIPTVTTTSTTTTLPLQTTTTTLPESELPPVNPRIFLAVTATILAIAAIAIVAIVISRKLKSNKAKPQEEKPQQEISSDLAQKMQNVRMVIEGLKQRNIDTEVYENELMLAEDALSQGMENLANMHLDNILRDMEDSNSQ